jgi:amino acid permease
LIYAFVGFEAAVIPAGETKNPQKDMPFALFTALVFFAALFIIIQIWPHRKRRSPTQRENFWAVSARLLLPSARSSPFSEI